MEHLYRTHYRSPIGMLRITCDDRALRSIERSFEDANVSRAAPHALLRRAAEELDAYFAGARQAFTLPLAPRGTPFQLQVWQALSRIPYGTTVTYGMLAAGLGAPRAARAVGRAIGANPLLVVIPCHRVTAAHGIGGFSAGLDAKRILLAHEAQHCEV